MIWNKPQAVKHPPLRGINLGGWLVVEKWITPSLFEYTDARDEHGLSAELNPQLHSKLVKHRDSFITRDDFVWLKRQGIEAVRLPVGYWAFGNQSPYSGCIEYIDKAFAWAAETGLYILLDIHAAPGSQNGQDHSGQAGQVNWAKDEANVIKTLEFVSQLAKRYARHSQLLGFELLNEPKHTISKAVLLRYYTAAYKLIRDTCGPNVWIVFHDSFRPRRWQGKLRGPGYKNLLIDTHQYQTFSSKDKKLDVSGHFRKTIDLLPKQLAKMRRYHPLMIGEWSLALNAPLLQDLDAQQVDAAHTAYGAFQLLTYSQSSAWFFWTYKTEAGGVWSFRDCIIQGWLPSLTSDRWQKHTESTTSDNVQPSPRQIVSVSYLVRRAKALMPTKSKGPDF